MSEPRPLRSGLRAAPSAARLGYRLDELVALTNVSRSTWERAIRDGSLKASRIHGRTVFVTAIALEKYLEANIVGGGNR